MKFKMQTSLAGDNFSYQFGDLVDQAALGLTDEQIKAWLAAGVIAEAPGEEVAAAEIGELREQLSHHAAASAGFQATVADLEAQLAKVSGDHRTTLDEVEVLKRQLGEAENRAIEARDAANVAATDAAKAVSAAEADRDAAEADRDAAEAAAKQLGADLEAARAQIADLQAAADKNGGKSKGKTADAA